MSCQPLVFTHVLNDGASPVSDEGLGRVRFRKIEDEVAEVIKNSLIKMLIGFKTRVVEVHKVEQDAVVTIISTKGRKC